MVRCLHEYGCLVVRDSRVSQADNNRFIDMMERYFEQDDAAKRADSRPGDAARISTAISRVF